MLCYRNSPYLYAARPINWTAICTHFSELSFTGCMHLNLVHSATLRERFPLYPEYLVTWRHVLLMPYSCYILTVIPTRIVSSRTQTTDFFFFFTNKNFLVILGIYYCNSHSENKTIITFLYRSKHFSFIRSVHFTYCVS